MGACEKRQPSVLCLVCELHRMFAWIEHVEVQDVSDHHLDLRVEHSYPEGIDIRPTVKAVIREIVSMQVQVAVQFERVPEKSGVRSFSC